ncbi:MAG: hypothetical protein HUJ26_18040 [Planctomycetaceae bacterium]|nr:hypothetical protein [Planctomycetaceae bacterium]
MSLIPNAFLFESQQTIQKLPKKPARRNSLKPLSGKYALDTLQTLDDFTPFARLSLGWHPEGLQIDCRVEGKQGALKCDPDQPTTSDGLHLWIDTRNTPGVHRANRFCHQISVWPSGGGKNKQEPIVQQVEIARCREKSPLADPELFWAKSTIEKTGYELSVWIPADALNGYDPEESPVCGFFYAVRDRELGLQTPSVGEEFPFASDPSLWHSIELTD